MAAPTVRGRTAPVAGLSATSPAGTQIGDAVIVFTWEQAAATAPTHTLQSTFVSLISHLHDDASTDGRLSVAYKIATVGGATAYQAFTSSIGTTVRTGCIVLQVGTHSLGATNTGKAVSAGVTSTSNAIPNPPSVTLGGSRDYLVIAIAGWHLGAAATVTPTVPTNYSNLQHVAGSSASEVASAERALTAPASEDPGTFGDDVAPNGTAAVTIGFANPVERTALVGATAGPVVSGTFFSIESRAALVGATGLVAVSGVVVPAPVTHTRSAALAATAGIASTATFFSVFARSAALAAVGNVAVAGTRLVSRSAALAASAAIATSATFLSVFERALALAATAGIATDPERDLLRSASVAATGSISTSGTFFSILERSASTSATGLVAVSGLHEVPRSAALAASATISTDSEKVLFRSASLAAVANVSTSGQIQAPGEVVSSAHFSATGGIAVSGIVRPAVVRSASVAASASVSVSGSVVRFWSRSAALDALARISANGVVPSGEVVAFPTGHAPVVSRPNIPRIGSVPPARVRKDFQRRGSVRASARTQGRIAGGSR